MSLLKEAPASSVGKSAPSAVVQMVQFLLHSFRKNSGKTATIDWFHQNFAGGPSFTFPVNLSKKPSSPFYHLIEGTTVFVLRWEILEPGIFLSCPKCKIEGAELSYQRLDFTKNLLLTPIFDMSGHTKWACRMTYCCSECRSVFLAKSCWQLCLSARLRQMYPVDPRYATSEKPNI